jgi:two-component system KDP operon response regulator KdpE
MRILIVDDEAQIRRLLEITFAGRGWEVFTASTGFEGMQSVRGSKPDVVLLDLNLPDIPGKDVLAGIREWSSVPVIIVSVRNAVRDIVELLNGGADDYVVKPFNTMELAARVEAVARRRMPDREPVFVSAHLRMDRDSHEVRLAGEIVKLTPTEYSILEILARYSGKIVTREGLLREIWGPAGQAEESNLRVYISSLRKKIEANPVDPELIVTEPGVGYRLRLLPVRPAPSEVTTE